MGYCASGECLKRLIWVLAVVTVLVGTLVLVIAPAHATYINESITSNTTWTPAEGPYRLTRTIWIYPGVTLTIEPGTIVDLYSYGFIVSGDGTFFCRGTSVNKIILYSSIGALTSISLASSTNWTESSSGCIFENTVLSDVTLSVTLCSPKISNNYFTGQSSVGVNDASPLISNNAFDCKRNCISVNEGSPTICNNFIKSSSNYGIDIYNRGSPNIFDNNITGCNVGIYVSGTGNTTITRNLITANAYGIYSTYSNGNITVQDNVFSNHYCGIRGGGNIRNNLIGNSNIGMQVTSNLINLTQNNLVDNTLNLQMAVISPLNASYNWWGSKEASVINQTIYDYKNNTSLGNVTFSPYLNLPSPDAPAPDKRDLMPAPTPTPFVTPVPLPSPSVTPYPTPTPPPSDNTDTEIPQTEPTSSPTPSPSPTPCPTAVPTAKIDPGSPLTFGNDFLTAVLTQLDLMQIAGLVLAGLGIMWVVVLLVSASHYFLKKKLGKE